ncbi:MAG: hypothetical protein Q4G26_04780 [Paracoccus sp. (in: a-proteobacteria)]|nr:hypothetical protein [Paracoccus sp. (in: a-proteobacteria)]
MCEVVSPTGRFAIISFSSSRLGPYGITYNSPIYDFAQSVDDVKYRLLQIGVSTNSLEGISIFADSFSVPSDETILGYLGRKEALCRDIISFLSGGIEPGEILPVPLAPERGRVIA